MEFHGNGVVLLPTDFAVKDEKKDERVDRILNMIERKHDWSNHVWGVEKVTSSGFEESDEEEGEEGQEGEEGKEQAADTEIGESSHVAENVNITADVSGKNKGKHADRGAESRKKKVLCQLAASSKGNIDTDMKKFLEGLVEASFMTFEEKFSNIFDKFETVVSDRLGKIETEVTRLGTSSIEAEVTQLRTSLLVTELAEKTDQPSGPSKRKIDTSPTTSKKDTVPSKKKAVKKKELKSSQSSAIVNLPPVNLSQSSAIDLRLGTQDFLESCMKNLSQDTFVKCFNPSQVKAEDSLDWLEAPTSLKMSPRRFTDRDIELAGADEPDSCLVYVRKEDFEKMLTWQDTRTSIQIGPSVLDEKLAARVIGPTKWLQNNEIDAVMYVFRERTTLQRWKVDRVAFMTCVFSDLIATDYKHFLDGIKNYKMDPLLLEYGKGELPSHGRTRKLWNVDVDRMYVPVWVNRNHWIALCISFVTSNIQVFDCSGRSVIDNKASSFTPYSVSIVPMSDLNQLNCHCGVYMLKHIECHVLGLDISLVNDDNIREARIKTMWDLWEAATDPELIERMSKYEPPKSQTKEKESPTSTSAQPQSNESLAAAPWPRDPLTPFSDLRTIHGEPVSSKRMLKQISAYTNRDYNAAWSDYHCILYNGLLRMTFKPTKFICDYTTKEIGIVRDVKKMWKNMGLGTLGYNPEPMYPELVIQFLSSVELHYKSEEDKVASEGKLTFLSSGVLYEMSIHELCTLFGFETKHEACSLPKFPCAYLLWDKIADRSYVSREAKIAMLRNPVLRVVAKYLGHLLLGKEEAGSLTEDEAHLIHYGLPLSLRPKYDVTNEPPAELSMMTKIKSCPPFERAGQTLVGALFAQMLFEKKFRGLRPLNRKPLEESIGSLLTRIFKYHGIDLSNTPCVDTIERFDAQFFHNTRTLYPGKIYRFTLPDGTILHCKLPQPAITSLTSVLYTPPPPASKRRCGSSSSAPAQRQSEDDTVPDIQVDHTPDPSIEYLLPAYTGQYDSGPRPLDGTQQQQFAWTADTLVKLSTMMQTVWGALAKIRCPRPPACCRDPQASEPVRMTGDIPDVAGRSRLHRSRRAPGQSRSCSPEDHQ
ncbi:hypothetical protein Bca52824_003497 [Brassica carinata]|uniref:Ubiquitin-like protease family profile domain-containing protein n=1 Tax=Brassica carinata TaxID=52824 RepID=A0A8X8BER6_BRACI|nr:hypothetical protein Bca52824_003497 [Brassica carinata]